MASRYSREEGLQSVMLSEDEDSESVISEFDVFYEANDMEEGYRSVHDDDSGDDNARSEGRKRAMTTAITKVRTTQ